MDFVIVGVPKCGTSWVDHALRTKIPLSLPNFSKETFYLDRHFHLGPEWHRSLYDEKATRIGEVSPSYFSKEEVIDRLKSIAPSCRIVIALRDPYDRAVSALLHRARRGEIPDMRSVASIQEETWNAIRNNCAYKLWSEKWLAAFGPEQVLIVSYDDIRERPAELLNRILAHAGFGDRFDDGEAAALSSKTVFENAMPRSKLLVRLARMVTKTLQRTGLTKLAGLLQGSSLRKFLEKPGSNQAQFRKELERHIRSAEDFEEHVTFAEQAFGRKLDHWRKHREPGKA